MDELAPVHNTILPSNGNKQATATQHVQVSKCGYTGVWEVSGMRACKRLGMSGNQRGLLLRSFLRIISVLIM